MKKPPPLTASRARELLSYRRGPGELRWRVDRGTRAKAGEIAGSLRKDGTRMVSIDGRLYAANRLIWLLLNGTWPIGRLAYMNGDSTDLRPGNIVREPDKYSTTRIAAYHRDRRLRHRAIAELESEYNEDEEADPPTPLDLVERMDEIANERDIAGWAPYIGKHGAARNLAVAAGLNVPPPKRRGGTGQ